MACTFLNPEGIPECGICGTPRECGGGGGGGYDDDGGDDYYDDNDEEDDPDHDGGFDRYGRSGGGASALEPAAECLLLRQGALRRREVLDAEDEAVPGGLRSAEAFAAVHFGGGLGGGGSSGGGKVVWSRDLDERLVELVNEICDDVGAEPQHLSAATIQDALTAPAREGSPLAADLAATVARFALLVVVNVRVMQLLPYVDLRGDVAQGALIHCGGWLPRT